MSVSKTTPMVGAVKTKENQVLGSPLTVSSRRVELTTSKEMALEEVLVLAKSQFEEGSQTHQEELFLKNTLSISLEHPSREE